MYGKVEWKRPPSFEDEIAAFLKQAFFDLESATFGDEKEFDDVLDRKAEELREKFISTKDIPEIKDFLRGQFELEGDPEKSDAEKILSSVREAEAAIETLGLALRKSERIAEEAEAEHRKYIAENKK